VVGRYDGKTFGVERVDKMQYGQPLEDVATDFSSPCPTPAGGWRAPDPERATGEDQQRVLEASERLPGFASTWVDDLGDSRQDPQEIVLNVAVTRDLDGAERALRKLWGGSLCVSQAKHTRAELSQIQTELMELAGVLGSGQGMQNRVELDVVYDDGTLQRRLDQMYGVGLVQVSSALRTYPR